MEPKEYKFKAVESLSLENSFGTIKEEKDITLEVTIGINHAGYGWFEIYDEKTQGINWYAEGGIWIRDNKITDYDGVYALPICIIDKLKELGYNTEDIE